MFLFAGYSWRLIGNIEDPEAATLEVHGHHVYHRQADWQFQLLLTLTVGQQKAVIKANWCVTVVGAGGTPTCVYDAKSTEPETLVFPQQGLALAGVELAANTPHSGALNMRFNSAFPDPDALRGATLTIAVPAARGHILPTSYIWPQFAG